MRFGGSLARLRRWTRLLFLKKRVRDVRQFPSEESRDLPAMHACFSRDVVSVPWVSFPQGRVR